MSATDVGQFVALDPPQVITFVTGENMGHLEIANTSPTKNIAFKIRTTQPLCYVVKPNAGIIEAMGKIKAEINFVPNEVRHTTRMPLLSILLSNVLKMCRL